MVPFVNRIAHGRFNFGGPRGAVGDETGVKTRILCMVRVGARPGHVVAGTDVEARRCASKGARTNGHGAIRCEQHFELRHGWAVG